MRWFGTRRWPAVSRFGLVVLLSLSAGSGCKEQLDYVDVLGGKLGDVDDLGLEPVVDTTEPDAGSREPDAGAIEPDADSIDLDAEVAERVDDVSTETDVGTVADTGPDGETPAEPIDAESMDTEAPDAEPLDPDVGESPPEKLVQQNSTYSVAVSTHVYAEGWRHQGWGGPQTETMALKLDVYEPTDAPPGRPAMVVIHGGGFKQGTRSDSSVVTFAQYFAERGWVTMSISYRLIGDHGTVPDAWADLVELLVPAAKKDQGYALYPAARDAKAAMRWLAANAGTYQIDLNYLTTLGGSAGAYLAIMLGVTDPADFRDELTAAQDSTLVSTNPGESFEVHSIIDHWGGISHMELLHVMSGTSRFDPTDAPVSIVHGTADSTVSFEEAVKLRDAYISTGVAHDFHPLEGVEHSPWSALIDGLTLPELAFAFVVEHQNLTVLP